jgi:photosystem II core protein PsbZ
MITLLTVLFVFVSLLLVVTVPVALATPGEWEGSKENFTTAFKVWIGLVFVIATADGITTSI